jgi:hypothetical protein
MPQGFCAYRSPDRSGIAHRSLACDKVHARDPTQGTARQPITHDPASTGLYSDAGWEQNGNRAGNIIPMRPQYRKSELVS